MKIKRIVSALLVLMMVLPVLAGALPAVTYAAETEEALPSYLQATDAALVQKYEDLNEKLKNDKFMSLVLTCAGYQLYCNPYTGEVVYYNLTTGQSLSTNPVHMGEEGIISSAVKAQLLSQVSVTYKGRDGNLKSMYSFTDAAQRGQIVVKNIKNGIRVQYTIGRENTEYLLPGWIMKEDLENKIFLPFLQYIYNLGVSYGYLIEDPTLETYQQYYDIIKNPVGGPFEAASRDEQIANVLYQYTKLEAYYTLQNPNDTKKTSSAITAMQREFPITAEKNASGEFYQIYTIDEQIQDPAKNLLEVYIKTFAPDYGYDDLAEDHARTGYVAESETPPLFKLALEYTIDPEDGSLNVRLPASSIRYDETIFTLEDISILNYFGAGDMNEDGFVFYPDGSGAIFEFSDLYDSKKKDNSANLSWTGKVYGEDYAYYKIAGQHQSVIRMPVYGLVSSNSVMNYESNQLEVTRTGFVAIMEEGDALSELTIATGATRHPYASIYPSYDPRPKDTYDINGSQNVSTDSETAWTVVSDRMYTGSYRTKIIMLTDPVIGEQLVAEQKLSSYYSAESWVGMAKAYRDYLENKGLITRFTEEDVREQLPLYIESFGTIETTEQVFSMPVTVDTPLTTFEDVLTMYTDLSGEGISNVNFKLTGFANGGMISTYPAKLKWQKAAGGADGFRMLLKEAKASSFGVYPEFDFSYISDQSTFDGISLKKLGARTVDDRYTSKRIYDAVSQDYFSYFQLCVASNRIEKYYDKFAKKYSSYEPIGISVSTLASDLNSNFDEDNAINREDAKSDVMSILDRIQEDYGSVMASGGNIFAVPYVDHLLEIPLDGSNYRYESATVPFYGMVLHGYVNFAGPAINESGNTDYNLLKSIENGASLYYLLSYRNATKMKESERWSEYYSVRYDIWFDEMVRQYNYLNEATADLQDFVISDHKFLRAERIPDAAEVAQNNKALSEAIYRAVAQALVDAKDQKISEFRTNLETYQTLHRADAELKALKKNADALYARLAELLPELTEEKLAEIAKNYRDGKDAETYYMQTGLKVGVVADLEKLLASITSFTGKELTEEEMKNIYYVIMQGVTAFDVEEKILSIANRDRISMDYFEMTQEKMYEIARLIVDGADQATLAAKLPEILNSDVTDDYKIGEAEIAEIAEALASCIYYGDVTVSAENVVIDYNFNRTDSDALSGDAYVSTAYTLSDEHVVLVTYSNQTKDKAETKQVSFVLNYNIFDISVVLDGTSYTVPSYGYVRIEK